MVPFLGITFLFVIQFTIVNLSVEILPTEELDPSLYAKNRRNKRLWLHLSQQYLLLFGENPASEFEFNNQWIYSSFWTIYILSTLLMNVVLLNLLITIIGDQIEKVQATLTSFDNKAKCEMILDQARVQ